MANRFIRGEQTGSTWVLRTALPLRTALTCSQRKPLTSMPSC